MSSEAAADQSAFVAAMDGSSATSPKRRRLNAFEAAGDVILTVWSVIGSFLDPLDLSRCAKTCRELRKVTINEHDGKIIATHLRIGYSNKPQYRYRSLLSVCSPKIRSLSIVLRGSIVDGREIRDERTVAFSMLVSTLSACRNLEEFSIDTNCLFENDRPGILDISMELFREFLSSCQRLYSLTIYSGGLDLPDRAVETFLQTITKIIARNRLSTLSLRLYDSHGFEGVSLAPDLAPAILQADNLEDLELSGNCPFFTDMANQMKESSKNRGRLNAPPGLLRLEMRGDFFQPDRRNLSELLNFYGKCHSLQRIELAFQRDIWDSLDDCSECLKALLQSKKHLRKLSLEFGGIEDRKVGDFIADLATTKEWTSFYVEEIRFSTKALNNILQHLKQAGINYEYSEMDRITGWVDCRWLLFPKRKI